MKSERRYSGKKDRVGEKIYGGDIVSDGLRYDVKIDKNGEFFMQLRQPPRTKYSVSGFIRVVERDGVKVEL